MFAIIQKKLFVLSVLISMVFVSCASPDPCVPPVAEIDYDGLRIIQVNGDIIEVTNKSSSIVKDNSAWSSPNLEKVDENGRFATFKAPDYPGEFHITLEVENICGKKDDTTLVLTAILPPTPVPTNTLMLETEIAPTTTPVPTCSPINASIRTASEASLPQYVESGETLSLIAQVQTNDVTYLWEANGELDNVTDSVTNYTAPDESGMDTISLQIESACASETLTHELTICQQLDVNIADLEDLTVSTGGTLLLEATANQEDVVFEWSILGQQGEIQGEKDTATFYAPEEAGQVIVNVDSMNQCMFTSEAVAIINVEDDIEIVETPEVEVIAIPQLPSPEITSINLDAVGALSVCWSWDGTLGADNNFAVRFWPVGDPSQKHSLVWKKENCYQFQVDNSEFPQGEYFLNIAIMVGPPNGAHEVLVESEPLLVNVPDIYVEPTLPPPP